VARRCPAAASFSRQALLRQCLTALQKLTPDTGVQRSHLQGVNKGHNTLRTAKGRHRGCPSPSGTSRLTGGWRGDPPPSPVGSLVPDPPPAPVISSQLQPARPGSRQQAADERLSGKRALVLRTRECAWLYCHSDAPGNKVTGGCKPLQDQWLPISLSKACLCQRAAPDDTLVCIGIFFFFPYGTKQTLLDGNFSFSLRFFSFQCARLRDQHQRERRTSPELLLEWCVSKPTPKAGAWKTMDRFQRKSEVSVFPKWLPAARSCRQRRAAVCEQLRQLH